MRLPSGRKAIAGMLYRPTGMELSKLAGRITGKRLEDAVSGKVVLVSGASSGIGRATALLLGRHGAEMLLVARSVEKLEQLRDEIEAEGGTAHAHPCDLTDEAEIARLTAVVLERYRRVDVLVNNAGRSIRRPAAAAHDRAHDYERTMRINYFAAVRLVLAFLPGMREQRSGHVVNISSAGVNTRVPRFSAYVASKAALDAFSESVAGEVAHEGIRFTTVHMPLVRTPMIEPTRIYRGFPSISAETAAEWIGDAIIYRPRRVGTQFSDLSGLMNAIAPAYMELLRNVGFRLFPDSGDPLDAKASSGNGASSDQLSRLGSAFARLAGGTYW